MEGIVEIPDSEDESGLDSQDLARYEPQFGVCTKNVATEPPQRDIWDFPDSEEESVLNGDDNDIFINTPGSPQPDPNFTEDDISTSFVRITAPTATPFNITEETPSLLVPRPAEQKISGDGSREGSRIADEQGLRQVVFRSERSLRPRKPIQEHPYALENAKYSSTLKRHGIVPVRFTREADSPQLEALSQDDEFIQGSQRETLIETPSGSQSDDLADAFVGTEKLAPSLSSPLKNSPLRPGVANRNLPSSPNDTDDTSIPDQDLPDLEHLLNQPWQPRSPELVKHRTPRYQSAARRRMRLDTIRSDLPNLDLRNDTNSSPISLSITNTIKNQRNANPHTPVDTPMSDKVVTAPLRDSMQPAQRISSVIEVPSDISDSEMENMRQVDWESTSPTSDSESGAEMVLEFSRRMKGVLPASWLRLDQQLLRDNAQKLLKNRKQNQPGERKMRRGVAQPKLPISRSPVTQEPLDDSDDASNGTKTSDERLRTQSPLPLAQVVDLVASRQDASYDEWPIVEEDYIDPMMPSKKRLAHNSEGRNPKRRKQPYSSNGRVHQKQSVQTKLDSFKPQSASGTSRLNKQTHARGRKAENSLTYIHLREAKGRGDGQLPSQHLSILDLIEPGAPQFLRIAARTAKDRLSQGRSSPNNKNIRLASRQDNVDVISVLRKWKSGLINQRPSVSATSRSIQRRRRQAKPLTEALVNPSIAKTKSKFIGTTSRKLVKHIGDGGIVSYLSDGAAATRNDKGAATSVVRSNSPHHQLRLAQLEAENPESLSERTFHSWKRVLDSRFRSQQQQQREMVPIAASSDGNDDRIPNAQSKPSSRVEEQRKPALCATSKRQAQKISRFRKSTKPVRIDTEAPQFTYPEDRLTAHYIPASEIGSPNTTKLQGLKPFGTKYTHDFEVFPLDSKVFFHDSTLIGSGILESCLNDDIQTKLNQSRPRIFFNINNQVLRWGVWNDEVSSEIGILLDSITEQLETDEVDNDLPTESTALCAARFILSYVKDSLSLEQETAVTLLISRLCEILLRFTGRISTRISKGLARQSTYLKMVRVFDFLLLVSFLALKICRNQPGLVNEQFQVEDLLKLVSSLMVSVLLRLGVDRLKNTYNDLSSHSYREQGLRDDAPAIHSWTLLQKILGQAQIRKASFWDVLHSVIISSGHLNSVDARILEETWETMFVLLPLVEFSDSGVLISGNRHLVEHDGWSIPQHLLKQILQLYQQDNRQAPNFNNYCRALVARCHYLVQQWGWHRSGPVIGIIFDFFGAQNLAHLRNEEVHSSPRFLEELSKHPSLDVEVNDRCFHIFLKLLALSIRKLKARGFEKDVRNLVARTIPNHNRQYLKEQYIHERDLAALRNHHDLIGTLFWISPPKLRPTVSLMERLVTPEHSHKEACLINMRAWSQLARFVVASGEATTSFKPFSQWRNTFFQQMLSQYDLIAADIHQQYLALSKDLSKSVTQIMINDMVSMNKATVMEVIYLSVEASLEVMRHALDLEAATFCLSTPQLQQVFNCFAKSSPELNWCVLRASLATLDAFLLKVGEFKDNEESQQTESQILNSAQADDALLVVDRDLSRSFFLMARYTLSSKDDEGKLSHSTNAEKRGCTEQAILLSARIGMRFIVGGLISVQDMFKPGKYGLFDDAPHLLDLTKRKYLALFLSALLENGLGDLADSGLNLCEVWILSLVTPTSYTEYENRLAEQLRHHGKDFVPASALCLSVRPDYNSKRDLFEFAISWMRRSILNRGPSLERHLSSEHTKALRRAMEQIQLDLKAMSMGNVSQHHDYVIFIREIVSLIKAHGSGFCSLDNFFYQISKEYSPPSQDPQLQVAGMVSYGLRLQEGMSGASHRLFFLLFNNFKYALSNGKLQDDVDMLIQGVRYHSILEFVLGKMLPAIIRASLINSVAFPMMDVYVKVIRMLLGGRVAPYELGRQDLPNIVAMMRVIVEGMREWFCRNREMSGSQVHVMRQIFAILNLLQPSLLALSVEYGELADYINVVAQLSCIKKVAVSATTYLQDLIETGSALVETGLLLQGSSHGNIQPSLYDKDIINFSNEIIEDIARNWITGSNRITIQTPVKSTAERVGEKGIEVPIWKVDLMVFDLYERIQEWCWWYERCSGELLPLTKSLGEMCFY